MAKGKDPGGRPLVYKTREALQTAVDAYFADSSSNYPWTMSGLAYSVGLSRQALLNYSGRPLFMDTINKAKAKVEAEVERIMMKGQATAGCIFSLCNNFQGWQQPTSKIESKNQNINSLTVYSQLSDPELEARLALFGDGGASDRVQIVDQTLSDSTGG